MPIKNNSIITDSCVEFISKVSFFQRNMTSHIQNFPINRNYTPSLLTHQKAATYPSDGCLPNSYLILLLLARTAAADRIH